MKSVQANNAECQPISFTAPSSDRSANSFSISPTDVGRIVQAMSENREFDRLANFKIAANANGLIAGPADHSVSNSFIPEHLLEQVTKAYALRMVISQFPFEDLDLTQTKADALYCNGAADAEIEIISRAFAQSGLALFPKVKKKATILTFSEHISLVRLSKKSGDI